MKPGSGCPNLAILPRPTQARNSGRGKASTELVTASEARELDVYRSRITASP